MMPFIILTPLYDLASAQSVLQLWKLCKPALLCLDRMTVEKEVLSRTY